MKKCSIFLIFILVNLYSGADYFDDNFDNDKNCKQQDLISKLEKSNDRCATKAKGKTLKINQ